MAWQDDLRNTIGIAADLGREAVSSGARLFNEWAEARSAESRMNEFDDRISKAAASAVRAGLDGTHDLQEKDGAPVRSPKAVHFDPFDLVAAMGYRERPTTLSFAAMEMIGRGVPVIADVIQARVKQTTMFCDLPEDRHSPGLRVRHKDWRRRQPDKKERTEAERLEDLLLHTGHYDPTQPHKTVTLREFATVFIHDSLTFDQATFEPVPDRLGRPSYLAIVDPASVRLLDPGARSPGDPFAVQVINGAIVADFTPDELAFCVRNPRSGIRSFGYGTSEVETLVREITGFLWGMDYNRKMFTQGSATKGILNFKGTIPDRHLQSFRRQWYAMVSGVSNAWRTPITNAEELQWINMQMSNRDMEYSAWMDFLIKIVCARYNIATEEVNFAYGNTGQSQAMGQAPIEEKLKASRDLGLRPLVRWFFMELNRHFVSRLNPEFEALPVGLDAKGEDAEAELLNRQVRAFLTVDEARARAEMPPLPEGKGEIILDPTWMQFTMSQQSMGGGPEGGPEGGGAPEGAAPEGGEGQPPPENTENADTGGMSVGDNEPPFDIGDEEAVKSIRPEGRVVRYVVDLPNRSNQQE